MEIKSLLITAFMLIFVSSYAYGRVKDISTDEEALVALRAHITNDPLNLLAANWSSGTSVCNWIGISCGVRHHRVRALNLSYMGLTGTIPPHVGNLSFLVSLSLINNSFQGHLPNQLANLRRLQYLNLKSNFFGGKIPSWIGSFTKLQVLALPFNNFEGIIPTSVSNLSNLYDLYLSYNSLQGNIPETIGNLYNLKLLYLDKNKLSGPLPTSMSNLSSVIEIDVSDNWLSGVLPPFLFSNKSSLEFLDVSVNNLTGHLSPHIFTHLSKLKGLFLSYNTFDGPIPSTLFGCTQLRRLSLSVNYLRGSIHTDIGNLTMLRTLHLGFNNFSGAEIPTSIGNLVNLEILSVERGVFSGSIPTTISNLTLLKALSLQENGFVGEIPPKIGNLIHLEFMILGINNIVGFVPFELFNISTLVGLSLVQNHLSGHIPSSFGLNQPNLEKLLIAGNNFSGQIPRSLTNASKLTLLDLKTNFFFGPIPDDLGNLKNLQYLGLAQNYLTSKSLSLIFSSLTNCRYLQSIELSINPLIGPLPTSLGNLSSSLENFRASNCELTGTIPEEIFNLTSLITLYLYGNYLRGAVPTTIGKLRKIQMLSLGSNKLQGSIPSTLCDLQSLGELNLELNVLHGPISSCLGNLSFLRLLYLGSNKFTSTIPFALWRLKDIRDLDLSSNSLSGSIPLDIGNLKAITSIDFSGNQLSGNIPPSFSNLKNLIYLYLSDNTLVGSIPKSFGDMVSLQLLNLSNNSLSGEIPKSLEKLIYMTYFNVSFNELQGEIPDGGNFAKLSAQSFLGNRQLCGAPKFRVQPCKTVDHNRPNKVKMIVLVIGSTILVLAIIIVFLRLCKKKTKLPMHQGHLLPLADFSRISLHELKQATDSFNEINLLGRGSFGSVYEGMLLDGKTIAVKVFNLQQFEGALKSFEVECQVLRRIRHRNLVKIITSCCTIEFKALVMEFMPNYSLEKWLYSYNYFLDILQRLNIMIDVATALEYLHHGSTESVVHCDIKPGNILLDGDMVARVSDFGIAKVLGDDQSAIRTMTLATVGYMAPEYGFEGLVSIKGDMYSYGILLMETFTRVKPTDEMFNEEMSMKQWIKDSLPLGVTQISDANLLRVDEPHYNATIECISSIMELALSCCADLPGERSDIRDALNALIKIRVKFVKDVE